MTAKFMSFVMFSLLSHNFKYTHIHTEWTLGFEQHGFELHESADTQICSQSIHITVLLHNLRFVESAAAESRIHRAKCKVLLGFLTAKEVEGIHISILFKGQLYIMDK